MVKEIFKSSDEYMEILYFGGEAILIYGDKITYFNMDNIMDTIMFVKMMNRIGIKELERARIMAKIMNLHEKN